MKKSFITLCAIIMALSMSATDLLPDSIHAVTWGTPLNLEAAKFADATAGQILKVTFTNASDGIEFKVPEVGHHVAGARRDAWISGEGAYEFYLTKDGAADVKAHGLQITGNHFTIKKVELLAGKGAETVKEGHTVWTGFFWVNQACTVMELFKDNFTQFDLSKMASIRFYGEAAEATEFTVNLKTDWTDAGHIANKKFSGAMGEWELTDEIRTKIADAGNPSYIMVQICRGEGADFNMTDIVLVPKTTPTAIEQTNADAKTTKILRNGMLVIEKNGKFYNALGAELK